MRQIRVLVLSRINVDQAGLVLLTCQLFLNTSLLTSEVTEVIELSATYLTYLVHLDALDVW